MASVEESLIQGWQIQKAGKVHEAERLYRQALAAEPENANAWCYLALAMHDQQRYDEAVGAYRRAIELKPDFPIAYNNLGNTFRLMRRLDAALEAFNKAIAQRPHYLIAFENKATTLCWEGRVEAALKTYEEAVKFAPNDANVHKHIGIMRLLLGDFAGGWSEYEWRWQTGEIKLPKLNVPKWDGSSLDGKAILLTPEQGLGDTIQFIRYAAWLKKRFDCRVVFHCPRVLRQLLSTCAGIDAWTEGTANLSGVDCFAPLLHVPSVMGHTPRDFPAEIPYLNADETLVQQWREKLKSYAGRRIGIAWRGSPTHEGDVMRSIPLAEFAPLMRLKGVHFFSLQKGPALEELNSLAGRLDVIDLGRELDENTGAFVETAAVLKNLDLLITCDTAIAHVAGALGVPVWVALCNVPDWRWLATGETTAWYPTMRLFRQTEQGDWQGVLEQISKALLTQFPDIETRQPADYTVATSGFNRLSRARDGLVLYDRHDQHVGRSIEQYGEFSADEAALFRQAIRPGWTVVEAGAGIGAHTRAFSRLVGPRGVVLAFEPRRIVFQTLCANMALSSIVNVHCRYEALSDVTGSIAVPVHRDRSSAAATSAAEPPASEPVPALALDSLKVARCHFIKIDVDGMELRVLQGAVRTIEKHRPLLYVSADRRELSPPVIELLQSLGYNLFLHTPPLFNPNNFYQNSTNEFGAAISINIFGVHSSIASDVSGLPRIKGPDV